MKNKPTKKRTMAETREERIKRLKPWPKGKSGNPNGRPHKVMPHLDKVLVEVIGGTTLDGIDSGVMEVVSNIFEQARDPKNVNAIRAASMLLERAYGKDPVIIKSQSDITSGGQPISSGIDISKLDTDTLTKLVRTLKPKE